MYYVLLFALSFYRLIFMGVNCEESNATASYDYCYHPDCSLTNQHTMCVAKNKYSQRLFASGITTWMRCQLLLLHNRHRDNIAMGLEAGQPPAANMRKMYWDFELEQMAELWARQCQKRHDECRNTLRFNVIQNMDVRPVVPRVTEAQLLTDVVGAWFSGSRSLSPEHVWSFRLSNCSAPGGCNSHWYSAATWASTWRIGCSQALCTLNKRSCVNFRKRRTTQAFDDTYINSTLTRSTESRNFLRRTKYTITTLQDLNTVRNENRESLLHRGSMQLNDMKEQATEESDIIAYTFCNYGPAGNIEGFPIYEAGTTCSNCPQGTLCSDSTHTALCSVAGDPDNKV